ncbi:hypothetical protein PYCC9005_001719 [Savitreella phatthalungensis]
MSLADLTQEKKTILAEAWSLMQEQIAGQDLQKRFSEVAPDTSDALEGLRYELFDLASFDDMDQTMLRFLRARKFNKVEACKMLGNALIWRRKIGIRQMMAEGEEALDKRLVDAGMYFIWGHDKEDRPIVYLNVGNFLPSNSQEETVAFTRFLAYEMETARFFIGSKGVLALGDLTGFGRKNIDMDLSKVFADMFQNYYPEILGKAVVIGSGLKMALFEGVYNIAKFWLDPVVRNKISFSKPKELSKIIDTKFIPKSLDGTFDEHALRAQAPAATAPASVDSADLQRRQLAKLAEFEQVAATLEAPQRDQIKRELRSLWLETANSRPRNLYQRLGLISEDGKVDWTRAQSV